MFRKRDFAIALIISIILIFVGCMKNDTKLEKHGESAKTNNETSNTYEYSNKDENSEINKILNKWQDSINSKDVEKYLSVFDDNMREISELNIKTAKEDEKKYLRFYAIKHVEYKKTKKVSLSDVHYYDNTISNIDSAEVYYFYFDAELNDNMETSYTKNGRNFDFCILTKQGGDWKISQMSVADVADFLVKDIDLGTPEEAELKAQLKKH